MLACGAGGACPTRVARDSAPLMAISAFLRAPILHAAQRCQLRISRSASFCGAIAVVGTASRRGRRPSETADGAAERGHDHRRRQTLCDCRRQGQTSSLHISSARRVDNFGYTGRWGCVRAPRQRSGSRADGAIPALRGGLPRSTSLPRHRRRRSGGSVPAAPAGAPPKPGCPPARHPACQRPTSAPAAAANRHRAACTRPRSTRRPRPAPDRARLAWWHTPARPATRGRRRSTTVCRAPGTRCARRAERSRASAVA